MNTHECGTIQADRADLLEDEIQKAQANLDKAPKNVAAEYYLNGLLMAQAILTNEID